MRTALTLGNALGLTILVSLPFAAPTARPLSAQELVYPETRRGDVVDDYHGTRIADPYRWLEESRREEAIAWYRAQNAVTDAYLEQLPGRDALRRRLTELWNHARSGVPSYEGGLYLYSHNTGLQDQPVYFVQKGLDAEPRELLDVNALSAMARLR